MAQHPKDSSVRAAMSNSLAESSRNGRQRALQQNDSTESGRDSSLLNPAPQHPLHTSTFSPSNPSFAASQSSRLQRRKKLAGEGESFNAINASDNQKDRLEKDFPRGKAEIDLPKRSALDRLEGWFGIADSDPSGNIPTSLDNKSNYSKIQQSVTRSKAPANPNKTTTLVLVHTVVATDTLEALSLRYNSDVRTLRKANGLWPGDKVQIRKEIYIPVNEEAVQTQEIGSSGINAMGDTIQMQHASEESNGKLSLLNVGAHDQQRHIRSISSASASSSVNTSVSYAQSASAASTGLGLNTSNADSGSASTSPELRRVPILSLSHFPPPGQIVTSVGEGKETADSKAFAFGTGMKPDENMEPGESGVEDLLQLAERARLRGSEPSPPPTQTSNTVNNNLTNDRKDERRDLSRQQSMEPSSVASSPSISTRGLEDEWKPNKYTLGQRKRQVASSTTNSNGIESERTAESSSRQGYQGWNDIPEPPLSKTAKGQVAHAYKPKRKYPRPGLAGVEIPGATLMEDLAAGLPANPGPAANWARPIGESLPIPAEASRGSTRQHASSSSNSVNNAGWGQILSDTVRGKIRLEDALERGWDDLRTGLLVNGSESVSNGIPNNLNRIARTSTNTQGINSDLIPQRPSAEMARAALSATGNRSQLTTNHNPNGSQNNSIRIGNAQSSGSSTISSLQVDPNTGASMRRSSGRSLHELEDLRIQNEDSHHSSTWSSASKAYDEFGKPVGSGNLSGREDASSSERNGSTRRNVRNIDWLG